VQTIPLSYGSTPNNGKVFTYAAFGEVEMGLEKYILSGNKSDS